MNAWKVWFAWYPVKTWPAGRWAWLRKVNRQRNEFNQVCYEWLDEVVK